MSGARNLQPLPFTSLFRGLRTTLVLLVSAVVCGCASSLPSQVDRPVTAALEAPQSTPLGSLVQQLRPASVKPQTSAFTLLSGAQAAYGARLALVEGAQQTLDLQYYAIHADESTQRLLRGVVEAARRGVRVRVLLDDFHSTGANAQVMRLAFVPGIEMRMFNPLAGARSSALGRAYTLLTDFQRAQQRMHNKLFIADNAMGVIGGRNLGDAYFDADSASNFVDLDVLAAGPVVNDLSRSFDSYWNNQRAYPVQSLISLKELKQLRERFAGDDDQTQEDDPTPAVPAKETKADDQTAEQRRIIWDQQPMDLRKARWTWASAAVLVDEPAKIPLDRDDGPGPITSAGTDASAQASPASNGPQARPAGTLPMGQPAGALRQAARPVLEADSVVDGLLALVRKTRRDLLVVSPYFVPGPDMMEAFRGARQRGVRVRILTNSLASNDAPLAHAGYARHRKALLEMGVELYEMRSTAASVRSAFGSGSTGGGGPSGSTGASRAMLHSKLLVVDGHLVAVGSMNLDLRSQLQNTEIALLIASREFGRLATQSIDEGLQDGSWRVEIDKDGELVWRASEDSERSDEHSEPDASWGLRLMLKLIGPLAPDHLL
ncbi:phospholipase D/Transphosphatidylase [Delftia acidovorans SPH-1]|uniref:Phospholipase D/Transphosphatidylase n=1 Tax=Delftia acidovorans (strain DSM 14801 / SPH-1) TaxID=398578 RepID=A9BND4_DELAS|nr:MULTISPECIES: phospholipase D family protein [Delftia]MCP4017399.1 phospholipase D family protein [Delftia sp.]ABX37829.1 phospholipase D/Transphosphatidylase [Delftia acidovorans SPH-1]MCP4533163.1 phospholipase D family protein [Delftia sp.]OLE08470.1 MAG: phospholipase [Delftia sp. 13_1_20CM_4_67_18]QPS72956.1 phospholipase D family protein [Delftia acidovorans]